MPELHNHDYLFAVTDKDIRAVLYDVGTARDSGDQKSADMCQYEPVFSFFGAGRSVKRRTLCAVGGCKEAV